MAKARRRAEVRFARWHGICAAVTLALLLMPGVGRAQDGISYNSGQTISPTYEGWKDNADGSYTLWFGYMNRNWEETPWVPVGDDNFFSPGPADQGQPTYFQPRYNRYVFTVQIPADSPLREALDGDGLVWTLDVNGEAKKAYATLNRDYYLDWSAFVAERGVNGGGNFRAGAEENEPPTAEVEGSTERTVRVGEPLLLTVHVTDDGAVTERPQTLPVTEDGLLNMQRVPFLEPNSAFIGTHFAVTHSWFVYRGDGSAVSFDPPQVKTWWDTRPFQSRWSLYWVPPEPPEDGDWIARITFDEPGTYVLRSRADDGVEFTDHEITVHVEE